MLFAIFVYAGIPGMFSAITLFRDGWHIPAAIMWFVVGAVYLFPILPASGLIAFAVSVGHAVYAFIEPRNS